MIRRRMTKKKGKPNIDKVYIKASGDYTIPVNCTKIDLFLVGGGGAGGSWVHWGYCSSGAGSGGGTNTFKNIIVSPGQTLAITVAKGGQTYNSNGGSTSVVIGSNTYTATGGNGGQNSQNGIYNSDPYNNAYKLNGATATHGASYNNSGLSSYSPNGSTTCSVKNNVNTVLATFDGTVYSTYPTTGDNPYIYNCGIPEFYESGMPTHAAGGAMCDNLYPKTSFTEGAGPTDHRYYNSTDNSYLRGGGGYGGGGHGTAYGGHGVGTGGDGVVVIREYFNQ